MSGKPPGPTTQTERILSLDVLRGFAVLGILVMNIQSFAMPAGAYFNPTAYGDLQGINYFVWLLGNVLFDMKFMTIFSLLFGAGIVLAADRVESKGGRPGPIHYRRTLILLLFGLAHAWLLWVGDILYTYAMCALLVYLFRRKKPSTLIIVGLGSVAVASLLSFIAQFTMDMWPQESLAGMAKFWAPDQEQVASELAAFRGGWTAQNGYRFIMALQVQTGSFLFNLSWRAGGLMLLGMALHKMGVFGAGLSSGTYRKMILTGIFPGLPLVIAGVLYHDATGWRMEEGFFGGMQFNYWGSLFVALGWVGAVMLFCKRWPESRLYRSLAATGQMAFTNYLTQTLICTTLFYGHGFGLFGSVERSRQILIVFGIWTAQLLWSPWWLARFRFGPLEWFWRSLTYLRIQPMRR